MLIVANYFTENKESKQTFVLYMRVFFFFVLFYDDFSIEDVEQYNCKGLERRRL
jgi:hypothetical protein